MRKGTAAQAIREHVTLRAAYALPWTDRPTAAYGTRKADAIRDAQRDARKAANAQRAADQLRIKREFRATLRTIRMTIDVTDANANETAYGAELDFIRL
jgi:hypothetical protein